jgi:hypothetical protein
MTLFFLKMHSFCGCDQLPSVACTAVWLPHKQIQPTINQFIPLQGNEQLLPLPLYFQAVIQRKCSLALKHLQK